MKAAANKSKILIVGDDKQIRWSFGAALLDAGYEVEVARQIGEASEIISRVKPHILLLDLDLAKDSAIDLMHTLRDDSADTRALLLHTGGPSSVATECVKMGAVRAFQKPLAPKKILPVIHDLLADSEIRKMAKKAEPIVIGNRETDRFILGADSKMRDIFNIVERVAASPRSTILIDGESGVGKELIAKAIHHSTKTKKGPFIEINCGSLPGNLLESELFGHEKGSFTDAKSRKKGLIEIADGGTLFLDEIGEMPIGLQAVLLRVIETKRFKRVGGTEDVEVDLRFVAATNQNLKEAVAEKRFRKDLYYRLNVVPIHVPPLRERIQDIPILATYFIDMFNRELSRQIRGLSPTARARLQEYDWPGNVRELRNVIERAILLESDDLILLEHLPLEISAGLREDHLPVEKEEEEFTPIPLSEAERRQILKTIEWARGNKTKAARTLGISRQTLREKLRQYEAK